MRASAFPKKCTLQIFLPISSDNLKIHQFRYFLAKSMGVSQLWLCICVFIFTATASARRMAEDVDGLPLLALPPPPPPQMPDAGGLRPGITVIVGAISSIFSITFIVLLYVKHCKTGAFASSSRVALPLSRVDSGVNRKVIEQLPLFRFSSLRGQKDGLECSVCLTRFEPEEVLRLLPKCKHAFHVDCVDTWLDEHSTCPLCRYRVRPEDVLLVDCHGSHHKALYNYSAGGGSRRSITSPVVVSSRHSSAGEGGGKGLRTIAEGPGTNESKRRSSFDSWSSRRRTGGSGSGAAPGSARRRSGGQLSGSLSRRDGRLSVQGDSHRLEHRIVVSDGGEVGQQRGSDVQTEEVLYLRTEMLLEGGAGEEEEVSGSGSSSSSSSGSSSGKKLIDEKNATEIKGIRKSRSDVGERKGREREEEGIVKKLLDWLPQFQQHHQQQQQKPPANSAAAASSSGPV